MIDASLRSITLCIIVSIAWYFGAIELYHTVTNFSSQWHWYVIASFYTICVNELFVHEFCHHSRLPINTNSWTYRILIFLASVDNAYVPVTGQCLMHSNHHMYADTKDDHANFKRSWHDLFLLSPWLFLNKSYNNFVMPDKENYFKRQQEIYKNILDDIWTFFCEEYRISLTIIFWAVLYFIAPIVLFKVLFMGRFLLSIFQFLFNIPGHVKLPFGYRNFNTPDGSYNNLWIHYLTLCLSGAALHNNHHGLRSYKTCQHRWFEFDLSKYVIAAYTKLMVKDSK